MRLPALPEGRERQLLWLLFSSGILIALYLNYGVSRFAARAMDVRPDSPAAVLWQYLAVFLFFFVAPLAVWRLVLRRPLPESGLATGDARYGLTFMAFTIPLLVLPLVWLGSRMPDVRAEYPLARGPDGEPVAHLWLEAAYVLYYLGWEYFFRGILILGVRDRTGDVTAVGFSMLVSTAIHLGKPEGEIWGAVLIGLVFGWLVVRTRSILWPFLLHALVGLLTDLLVMLGPGTGS